MSNKVAQYAAILEITGQITPADVKAAYHRQMLKWHPDLHRGKDTSQIAHTKAQAINEAYEFLSEITEEHSLPSATNATAQAYEHYRTRHTYQQQTFRPGFPDPVVFEVFVKSSWIISAGYNQQIRTLYLKLDRGSIYRCFDVPRFIFDELLQAESVGRYVNQNVFSRFRHESC